MKEFKDLEYADELYKIQLKFTEGDKEPLNSDEIDSLLKILKEQLEQMNGENDESLLNETILNRLKNIQENCLEFDKDDILSILRMVEDKDLRVQMIKEFVDMEIDTVDCYDMLRKFLEEDTIININGTLVNIAFAETIYNWYLQRNYPKQYLDMIKKLNVTEKKKEVLKFIEEVNKNNIVCNIFDTKRQLLFDIFVDGQDLEEITDSVVFLVEKGYDINDDETVMVINGKYVRLLY